MRPCVPLSVCKQFQRWISLVQWADRNQTLSEASLGWGKAALCCGADQPRTLVSMATDSSHRVVFEKTVLPLLLAHFSSDLFLYLQVTRTCMKAWRSSNIGQIRPPTMELAPHERLKKKNTTHRLIMGKQCYHFFSAVYNQILFILAGKDDIHRSLDEFEIRLDSIMDHRVSFPWASKKSTSLLFLDCFSCDRFDTCS